MRNLKSVSARSGEIRRAVSQSLSAWLLAVAVFTLSTGALQAQDRVALVLGNADYAALQPLANPVNDAKGIAASLERLGFEVTLVTDAPHDRLAPVLDAFAARAETADVVLFYYSGHAFQQNGHNLLVPSDASLKAPEAFAAETWSFSEDIVARLSAEGRQTLFFLDACRNNPLPLSLRPVASGDGLVKTDTGSGSFVAFATQPGAVARDGIGANSPFTLAMLKHMETPGISISDLMIRVRNEVVEATSETQVPWDQSSLRAQFYFVPVEEGGATITDADLDAIGGLDEESIRNVIGALAENGVTLEILVVEDEPAEIADATPKPIVSIEDTEPGEAGEQVALLDDTRSVASEGASERPGGDPGEPTLADKVAAAEAVVAAARAQSRSGPSDDEMAAVALPPNLALGVQQELSRVGCHRAALDGAWGPVSRISLLRYYTAKGKVTAEEARAEPTELAYRRLALEPGVVCEGLVAAPVRTASASTDSKRTVVQKVAAPAAATTAPKPTTPRISNKPTTSSSGTRVPPKINRAKPGVFR